MCKGFDEQVQLLGKAVVLMPITSVLLVPLKFPVGVDVAKPPEDIVIQDLAPSEEGAHGIGRKIRLGHGETLLAGNRYRMRFRS